MRVNAHVRRQVAGSARRPGARAQAARQAAGSACVAVREIRTPAGSHAGSSQRTQAADLWLRSVLDD